MADRSKIVAGNVAGNYFVDSTCIDCGTCRAHAPAIFGDAARSAIVIAQPDSPEAERLALEALFSCPTNSIGALSKPAGFGEARDGFPIEIAPGIYFIGFADEKTFGAQCWLIKRPGGNVLVDCAKPIPAVMRGIDRLGGVAWHFLTHRDDLAGHEIYYKRFGARRLLCAADARGTGLADGEQGARLFSPAADLTLDDTPGDEIVVISTPGHTRGSACLLWKNQTLFSGDHLAANRAGELVAFDDACWYDWGVQIDSLEKLIKYDFGTVLPGHGGRWFGEIEATRSALRRLIARIRK